MTGTVELTAAELQDVLAAVLEYNGYTVTGLSIKDDGGAVLSVTIPPIQVKTTHDDGDRLRDMLYPEVDTSWSFKKSGTS